MATYYIASTGNDSTGDGSVGNPWKTIAKAFTASSTGDTIVAAAGTWQGWGVASTLYDFTGTRTLIGAGADSTIIDGSGIGIIFRNSGIINVSNIQFKAAKSYSIFENLFENYVNVSAVWNFTNCKFVGLLSPSAAAGIFGVAAAGNGGTINFIGCLFDNCLSDGFSSNAMFINNVGSQIINMTNCTYYTNQVDSNTLVLMGNASATDSTLNINNCIFFNANGIDKAFDSFSSSGVFLYTGTTPTSLIVRGYNSLPAALSTVLTGDPLFVDAAAGVFDLRPGSPAIGAGVII